MNTPKTDLESLIKLAKADTTEGWAKIDSDLPGICNEDEVLSWARNNTSNDLSSLLDLTATIFEASDIPLTSDDINKLKILMSNAGYPWFRAACALAKRRHQQEIIASKDSIKRKLMDFIEDPDVWEIADKYIKKLDE